MEIVFILEQFFATWNPVTVEISSEIYSLIFRDIKSLFEKRSFAKMLQNENFILTINFSAEKSEWIVEVRKVSKVGA